ncbi:MAG: hypothetical protein J5835_03670, partial [Bacteroidales bacterium]|nr:hypothetical protein [Bacteroidales bacterium]
KIAGKYDELKKTVDSNLDAIKILNGEASVPGSVKNQIEAAKGELIDYVDQKYNELLGHITDLYNLVSAGLQRIQSVVFVPQYDDLKMDINVSRVCQTIINSEGDEEKVFYFMPQPTEVTFKVTPAENAEWLAYYVNATNYSKETSRLYKEYLGYSLPAVFFDVRKLNTRAGEEDESLPKLDILGVNSFDKTTGEITFLVEPTNIVSEAFVCNTYQPSYTFSLSDGNGNLITAGDSDGNGGDITGFNMLGALEWAYDMTPFIIPVWPFEDYLDFEFRDAYAASLTIYVPDADNWHLYNDSDSDLEMDEYLIFSNEVASSYSLLYPVVTECEIDTKPYKRITDENGDPAVREFTEEELHQTLPYNAFRSNGDYRVILQDAVPAVLVDDEPYGLFAENSSGGFVFVQDKNGNYIQVPGYQLVFEGFTYEKNTSGYTLNTSNFIETNQVYAEIEMNPARSANSRQRAVGNLITGNYSFNFPSGSIPVSGDVLIIKPES